MWETLLAEPSGAALGARTEQMAVPMRSSLRVRDLLGKSRLGRWAATWGPGAASLLQRLSVGGEWKPKGAEEDSVTRGDSGDGALAKANSARQPQRV